MVGTQWSGAMGTHCCTGLLRTTTAAYVYASCHRKLTRSSGTTVVRAPWTIKRISLFWEPRP
eukprot:2294537-Amphidinium_carterae.1